MLYYHALNRDCWSGAILPQASAGRYAWLEHEKGKWHFLTNLFADVREATRSWPTKQGALDELTREGWVVVGSYPENAAISQTSGGETCGYGLIWAGR